MANKKTNTKSKVIVFGGSGFIGNHVVSELVKDNYEVTIFDINKPKNTFGCNVIKGDILDQKQVSKTINGHSIVFNFAGWADLESSVNYPVEVVKQNVLGNTILLEEAVKHKVNRYMYASSVYVFSRAGSFYRASKQACELIIDEYQRQFGLNYTVLRFGSLYGPGAKQGNGIYDLLFQALKEKKINYWGTGEELRQYIHVNDAARGCIDALDGKYINEHVILAGAEDIRSKDLVTMINEMMNNKLKLSFTPKPRSEFHYKITPYSFNPKLGKKLVFREYTDIGQGLLQCMQEVYEEINSK